MRGAYFPALSWTHAKHVKACIKMLAPHGSSGSCTHLHAGTQPTGCAQGIQRQEAEECEPQARHLQSEVVGQLFCFSGQAKSIKSYHS